MRSTSGRTSARALLASAGVNVRATGDGDHLRRLIWWSSLVGFLAAIQYAGRAESGQPSRDVLYKYSTAVSGLVVLGVLLAVIVLISGGRRDLLALRRPRSWRRAAGLMALLLVGVYVAIAVIDPFLHAGREQGLTPTAWQPEHAGAYAVTFFLIVCLTPIVEELTFRGLGFSLIRPYGEWVAIVATGLAFGLAHGLVYALPELALFGSALAWLRARTESVYPGMILHGTFNAIALIAAVTVQP